MNWGSVGIMMAPRSVGAAGQAGRAWGLSSVPLCLFGIGVWN